MTEVSVDLYNVYSDWDSLWEKQPGMKLYPASSGQDVGHIPLSSLYDPINYHYFGDIHSVCMYTLLMYVHESLL